MGFGVDRQIGRPVHSRPGGSTQEHAATGTVGARFRGAASGPAEGVMAVATGPDEPVSADAERGTLDALSLSVTGSVVASRWYPISA